MPIDFSPFIHPLDKKTLDYLKSILLLDTILRKFMAAFDENILHGINMASMLKLSTTQMPKIYNLLLDICYSLEIPQPDLFLQMNPIPNAYTMGDTKPFIVINSGIVDLLEEEELKTVIAHECGHILYQHVLYHSLAVHLFTLGSSYFNGLINSTLNYGLLYWKRCSEYSADRVAACVMGTPDIVVNTMLILAAGNSKLTQEVNIDEFLQQARDYQQNMDESTFNKFLQVIAISSQTHPFAARRALEIKEWYENVHNQLPSLRRRNFLHHIPIIKNLIK